MKYRLFFIVSIVVALLVCLRLPIINGYVDYYRVLQNDYKYSYPGNLENKLYLKTKWLLDTKGEYHSIIFGSSRVIMGASWENLGEGWAKHDIPGGLPKESLNTLEVLLQNEVPLKEVILAIDDFDIYYQSRQNENDLRYRFYPKTWLERIDFWRFYLFESMNNRVKKILKGEISLEKNKHITGDLSGKVLFDDYQTHEEKIKRMDAWDKDMPFNYPVDIESTVKSISDFVKLSEKNGIKVTVLMTPRHYKILYSREFPYMAQFRLQLAEQVSYWDFTNLESGYWKDNHLWLETSHFGTELGGLMLDRIRGKKPDSSFGLLVNRLNVGSVIQNQYKILVNSYPNIMTYDSNTYIHDSYLYSWHTVDIDNLENLSITGNEPRVMKIQFNANEDSTKIWSCNKKTTTLYLTKGENTRYLPWSLDCLSKNKDLPIKAISVAKIKKDYLIDNNRQ